eukprot:jgi/Ulvmu1/5500/UM023_0036.1
MYTSSTRSISVLQSPSSTGSGRGHHDQCVVSSAMSAAGAGSTVVHSDDTTAKSYSEGISSVGVAGAAAGHFGQGAGFGSSIARGGPHLGAGRAADSAAAFTHSGTTFRPSALQYGFMNRSISLESHSRSQDVGSSQGSGGAHASADITPDASTSQAQWQRHTLDSEWEDMLDRRRNRLLSRKVADHNSERAVAARRVAGCQVDTAIVEQHGTAAEARARAADGTAAAEQVIAHLDRLTHDLAHAGAAHAARRPPPEAGSPAAFAAALAQLLSLGGGRRRHHSSGSGEAAAAASRGGRDSGSGSEGGSQSLSLLEPTAATVREQSDLLSGIMASHTSSGGGDDGGPLGDHSMAPDHSPAESALVPLSEPTSDTWHRAHPHSSSNPFLGPPSPAASDSVSNPFLSPPPSKGYPSSPRSSATQVSPASSIGVPIDPNGSTHSHAAEGESPRATIPAPQRGSPTTASATPAAVKAGMAASPDKAGRHTSADTCGTHGSDVSTAAVLDIESHDLHAASAAELSRPGPSVTLPAAADHAAGSARQLPASPDSSSEIEQDMEEQRRGGAEGGEPFLSVSSAHPPTSSSSCPSPHIESPPQSVPLPQRTVEHTSADEPSVLPHTHDAHASPPASHIPRASAEPPPLPATARSSSSPPTSARMLSGMTAVALPDSTRSIQSVQVAPHHVDLSPVAPSGHPLSHNVHRHLPGPLCPPSTCSSPPPRRPPQASAALQPPSRVPAPQPVLPTSTPAVAARQRPTPTQPPLHPAAGRYQSANPTAPPLNGSPSPAQWAESSSISISSSSSLALRPLADTATLKEHGATSSSITFQGELSLMHGDSVATDSSRAAAAPPAVDGAGPAEQANCGTHSSTHSGGSEDIATLSFAQQLRQSVEAAEVGQQADGRSASAALSDVTTPRLPSAPTSLFNTDSASASAALSPVQPLPSNLSPQRSDGLPPASAGVAAAATAAVAAAAAAAARRSVPPLPLQGPRSHSSPAKPTRNLNRLFQEPAAQRAAAAWHVRRPNVGPPNYSNAGLQHRQPQSHPARPRPRMTMREPLSDTHRRAPQYRVTPPSSHPAAHMRSSPLYLCPSDIPNPVAASDSDSPRQSPPQGQPPRRAFPCQPSPLRPAARPASRHSPRLSPRGAAGTAPTLHTARRAENRSFSSPAARPTTSDGTRSGVRGRSDDPAPCYSPRPFAPDDSYSMPERGMHNGDSSDDGRVGGGAATRPRKRSRGRDRLTTGDDEFFSVAELIRGKSQPGRTPSSGSSNYPRAPASTGSTHVPIFRQLPHPRPTLAAAASQPPMPQPFPSQSPRPIPTSLASARQPPPPNNGYGAVAPASMPPMGASYIPPLPRLPLPKPPDPAPLPPPVPRGVPPGLKLPSSQGTAHSSSSRLTMRPPKAPSYLPRGPSAPIVPPVREPGSPASSLAHSGSVLSSIPSNFLPPLMPPSADEHFVAAMAVQAALPPAREDNTFASGVLDLARETEATTAQAASVSGSVSTGQELHSQRLQQRQHSVDVADKASVSSSMMYWDEESPGRAPPSTATPLPQVPERSLSGDIPSPVAASALAAPPLNNASRCLGVADAAPGLAAGPASPSLHPRPRRARHLHPPTSGSGTDLRPSYWAVLPADRSGSVSGSVSPSDMRSLLNSLPNPASGVSFAPTPSSSSGSGTTPLTPMEVPGSITSNAAACRLSPRPGDASTGTSGPSNARAYATHSTSGGTLPSAPPSAERPAAAYGRMVVWPQATAAVPAPIASAPAGMPAPPLTRPATLHARSAAAAAASMAAALDMATMEGGWLQTAVASPPARMQTSISLQRRPAASAPPPTEVDTTTSDTVHSSQYGPSSTIAGRSHAVLLPEDHWKAERHVPPPLSTHTAEPPRPRCIQLCMFGSARAGTEAHSTPARRLPPSRRSSGGSSGARKLKLTGGSSPDSASPSPGGGCSRIRVGGTARSSPARMRRRRSGAAPGRLATPPPPPQQSAWRKCLCLRGRESVYDR